MIKDNNVETSTKKTTDFTLKVNTQNIKLDTKKAKDIMAPIKTNTQKEQKEGD